MKKLVLACAVLIASVGLSFAQSNEQGNGQSGTETQKSKAYMNGYMTGASGKESRCNVYNGAKGQYDCSQGYLQGRSDRKNADNGNYNSNSGNR